MQADPIGYGDGMNMYAYVGGDPVNFKDPSGLCQGEASIEDGAPEEELKRTDESEFVSCRNPTYYTRTLGYILAYIASRGSGGSGGRSHGGNTSQSQQDGREDEEEFCLTSASGDTLCAEVATPPQIGDVSAEEMLVEAIRIGVETDYCQLGQNVTLARHYADLGGNFLRFTGVLALQPEAVIVGLTVQQAGRSVRYVGENISVIACR